MTGCATPPIPERCSARTRSTPRSSRRQATSRSRCRPRGLRRTAARDLAGEQRLWREDRLRTYDDQALNPLRHQRSGVRHRKDLWESGSIPTMCRACGSVTTGGAAGSRCCGKRVRRRRSFGELRLGSHRQARPDAAEEELANAVADLLERPQSLGPTGGGDGLSREGPARRRPDQGQPAGPASSPAPRHRRRPGGEPGQRRRQPPGEHSPQVIPMPIFDPFAEADKRW